MEKTLLIYSFPDKNFLPRLKDAVGSYPVLLFQAESSITKTEILRLCESRNIKQILCSSQKVLELLLSYSGIKKASLDNYAGSLFKIRSEKLNTDIEIVFINPLEHLVTVSYGKFLFRRYFSKFTHKANWLQEPEFIWEECDESNFERIINSYQSASLIALDIETAKEPYIHITEVGYTAIWFDDGKLRSHSCVVQLDSINKLAIIRQLNDLPAAKIMQNGKYDLSYLARYNAVPVNYLWDTATLMHCWYSELPKDLGFLGAFFSRNAMYWKDLSRSGNRRDQLLYNCKDTYTTALAFLQMLKEIPQYAKENYLSEFPLLFPCHMAEMTGIKRDMSEMTIAEKEQQEIIKRVQESLDKILGTSFNVNSPVGMKKLLALLGCQDLESADAKNLAKASLRHPLNAFIINKVIKVRKARKLVSTYITEGKEFSHGANKRILYSLNPHGTETGRLASKEHHFWCGLQIQNIPRGDAVKRTLVADDGFVLAECDLEQAESRDTAHVSGDENLIRAVSSERDFHSINASAFFAVPYESIYDQQLGKTIDKALRDLAKRVNHGANYLMGAGVLVDTMGLDKVWEAQSKLNLPKLWTPKQVAQYLLDQFHKTYPKLSAVFYPGVVAEVVKTHMLASKAIHDAPYQARLHSENNPGWTRYCFGRPDKNKQDLNALVAHVPQSLNAMTLNKAFMTVFYDLAFKPEFKLLCQIHDSILFQVKQGHEYLIDEVKKRMEVPVTITGYDGITRTFTVPAAAKAGKDGNGASRWSATE